MDGILAGLQNVGTSAVESTLIGDSISESDIVLEALHAVCESDQEFVELLENSAVEMALYGIIDNADIATEVVKRIQVTDWKQANFNRIAKRTAIRLAMINNDPLYTKYKKYRTLLIDVRNQIYRKYGQKAKVEARKIIRNARNKAANMNSASGKNLAEKMDKAIVDAEKK